MMEQANFYGRLMTESQQTELMQRFEGRIFEYNTSFLKDDPMPQLDKIAILEQCHKASNWPDISMQYLENGIKPYYLYVSMHGGKWTMELLVDLRDYYFNGKDNPEMLEWYPDILHRIYILNKEIDFF